jgi:ParB family chromosome partitioning protein
MDSTPERVRISPHIQRIPIAHIHIVNARERNRKKFQQIVGNIADVGLKRPITVCPRPDGEYDLICGQGRLEAYTQLGQTEVPALIRDVTREELLLMSIIENMARARPTTVETVRQLAELRERGYNQEEIGHKTGLSAHYVHEMLFFYDHGEERVLYAVETGKLPLYAGMLIAHQGDGDLQAALAEAVAEGRLTAKDISRVKNLAYLRKAMGKALRPTGVRTSSKVTGDAVVRAFRKEQDRQREALKKATLCEKRLLFTVNALRLLIRDEHFLTLLRAEGLVELPQYLADAVMNGGEYV